MPRLRRSVLDKPGITRRKRGKGFELLDAATGHVIRDPEVKARVASLAIPPAWQEVWICTDDFGHIQATGIDAAGRRQYRYHDLWTKQQARRKFAEMEEFAEALPGLRALVAEDLATSGYNRDRVLAAMVRLLEIGFFRIGLEGYAEKNKTYGLATIRREHVSSSGEALIFDYPAKHGLRRVQHVVDPDITAIVRGLRRRRGGGDELFAFKVGREWHDVRSTHLNAYLKERSGLEISAKDFRTWGATVLCAVALAVAETAPGTTKTRRKRVQVQAIREVARYLGNTPAVCRASYVDPRVLDRHAAGETISEALVALGEVPDAGPVHADVEAAVLKLIRGA